MRAGQSVVWLALTLPLFAVDGVVMNSTTGKPQPHVKVTLVQPGQAGMQTVASTESDDAGKFRIDKTAQGPQLLQAVYEGITYNKMVMPGAPSTNLDIPVFESSNKRGLAQVTQHLILVQPSAEQLGISESLLVDDNSKYTYNDPANGTVQFYLPPEAKGKVQVTINAPGGMPIQRPASPTKQKDVYKVDYPIRPGETRFDINYALPVGSPLVFSGRILHKEGKARLVAPRGVTLAGENIQSVGQEPTTEATVYDVNGSAYNVEVQGTGSLQPPAEEAQSDEDSGQPQIHQAPPRIYEHMYWILGLAFGILGLGSYLLAKNAAATR